MTLSETGEINTWAFHSQVNLANPNREGKFKRICSSEPFMKPKMSSNQVTSKILSFLLNSKVKKSTEKDFSVGKTTNFYRRLEKVFRSPICLRDKKTILPQDLPRPIKKVQIDLIPQKNKSVKELPLPKQRVSIKQASEKAGGLQISKSEWKNITSTTAKVILDPNTANPTLKLSVDGCSVRTKTYKEFESTNSFNEYQRKYKHQYNGWTCVQAQEGYTSGRHYWEVDVKGKCDWRVGVVREFAKRNGFIKLNTAAGYWTLCLQLGTLMALTEPVTKLNQTLPSKIGVQLDVEKGQVSFYDAKEMKHMYTFKEEFRKYEKIYPLFGTVETDKPLKII